VRVNVRRSMVRSSAPTGFTPAIQCTNHTSVAKTPLHLPYSNRARSRCAAMGASARATLRACARVLMDHSTFNKGAKLCAQAELERLVARFEAELAVLRRAVPAPREQVALVPHDGAHATSGTRFFLQISISPGFLHPAPSPEIIFPALPQH
jgi:hypothetical protein